MNPPYSPQLPQRMELTNKYSRDSFLRKVSQGVTRSPTTYLRLLATRLVARLLKKPVLLMRALMMLCWRFVVMNLLYARFDLSATALLDHHDD